MAITDQPVPNIKNGNPYPVPAQTVTTDEAITMAAGTVVITKATAGAITIDIPPASMDHQRLLIISSTAAAHVVTCAADGFNAKGSSGTLTWAAAIGNNVELVAYNGHWYVGAKTGVTIA